MFYRFILRNYIAQNAIEAAENGDYSEVNNVLKLLENPYSEDPDLPTMTKPADLASQNKDGECDYALDTLFKCCVSAAGNYMYQHYPFQCVDSLWTSSVDVRF